MRYEGRDGSVGNRCDVLMLPLTLSMACSLVPSVNDSRSHTNVVELEFTALLHVEIIVEQFIKFHYFCHILNFNDRSK